MPEENFMCTLLSDPCFREGAWLARLLYYRWSSEVAVMRGSTACIADYVADVP